MQSDSTFERQIVAGELRNNRHGPECETKTNDSGEHTHKRTFEDEQTHDAAT